MPDQERYRKLDVVVAPQTGDGPYETWVAAHPREDGTWEAALEFRSADTVLRTPVETTQPDLDAVLYWASGLGSAYFDGAFVRAIREREAASPAPPPARSTDPPPTPLRRDKRLLQLRAAERCVMETFHAQAADSLDTHELFGKTPFANADLVRAFEELEKKWRYLVRRTEEGSDVIRLTAAGAAAIGRTLRQAEPAAMQPPSNRPPQR